ncbi:MAG: molybdate ABC transporter substrate-binding protein [Povalibacter sp.]
MRTWIAAVMVVVGFTSASIRAADSSSALTVFAAASLTDALQQIGEEFSKTKRTTVRFSFAASSALARQIESGAAVDVFVSADQEWMDYLDSRKLIEPGTRRDVVGNRLALVAPADSKLALKIQPHFALLAALGPNGRLATADPDSVPVGKYAKAALSSLGVWPQIESRLVRAENVRAALAFVARGEVPLGIVYETDAKADSAVKLIDLFPASSHPAIAYPAAAMTGAKPQAREFVNFLSSPTARAIFTRAGFQMVGSAP